MQIDKTTEDYKAFTLSFNRAAGCGRSGGVSEEFCDILYNELSQNKRQNILILMNHAYSSIEHMKDTRVKYYVDSADRLIKRAIEEPNPLELAGMVLNSYQCVWECCYWEIVTETPNTAGSMHKAAVDSKVKFHDWFMDYVKSQYE